MLLRPDARAIESQFRPLWWPIGFPAEMDYTGFSPDLDYVPQLHAACEHEIVVQAANFHAQLVGLHHQLHKRCLLEQISDRSIRNGVGTMSAASVREELQFLRSTYGASPFLALQRCVLREFLMQLSQEALWPAFWLEVSDHSLIRVPDNFSSEMIEAGFEDVQETADDGWPAELPDPEFPWWSIEGIEMDYELNMMAGKVQSQLERVRRALFPLHINQRVDPPGSPCNRFRSYFT